MRHPTPCGGPLRLAIDQRGYVREKGTDKLTSREALRWELEVVIAAHDGRNQHVALNRNYQVSPSLSAEQTVAVEKILRSRDFITLFRGGAGTGKSFTLKEVERGLTAAGHPVAVLAPQRQQVQDLQAEGLRADTLAHFLQQKQLAQDAVVIVDEAGQIGARQLGELIRLVRANRGRLILSGDTRQHGAVAASDALRAIEKHAGLKPAVIQTIRRQDPKLGESTQQRTFIRAYRKAVMSLVTLHAPAAFTSNTVLQRRHGSKRKSGQTAIRLLVILAAYRSLMELRRRFEYESGSVRIRRACVKLVFCAASGIHYACLCAIFLGVVMIVVVLMGACAAGTGSRRRSGRR